MEASALHFQTSREEKSLPHTTPVRRLDAEKTVRCERRADLTQQVSRIGLALNRRAIKYEIKRRQRSTVTVQRSRPDVQIEFRNRATDGLRRHVQSHDAPAATSCERGKVPPAAAEMEQTSAPSYLVGQQVDDVLLHRPRPTLILFLILNAGAGLTGGGGLAVCLSRRHLDKPAAGARVQVERPAQKVSPQPSTPAHPSMTTARALVLARGGVTAR